MEDIAPAPRRKVLRLRMAFMGVLVFCGVMAALASALCALIAWNDLWESLPVRITREDLDMLASGGAGFIASLAAPAWVWWHMFPRARRAGVLTMAVITWLLLGGIGALQITVQTVQALKPHHTTPVDPSIRDRLLDPVGGLDDTPYPLIVPSADGRP